MIHANSILVVFPVLSILPWVFATFRRPMSLNLRWRPRCLMILCKCNFAKLASLPSGLATFAVEKTCFARPRRGPGRKLDDVNEEKGGPRPNASQGIRSGQVEDQSIHQGMDQYFSII